MITFIDGPADGVSLTLNRTPILLRVVCDVCGGGWDALDQLSDFAKDDETIHVYQMIGKPQWAHIDGVDRKTGRRFGRSCWMGKYRYMANQPGDLHVRDNASWSAWCESVKDGILAERETKTA